MITSFSRKKKNGVGKVGKIEAADVCKAHGAPQRVVQEQFIGGLDCGDEFAAGDGAGVDCWAAAVKSKQPKTRGTRQQLRIGKKARCYYPMLDGGERIDLGTQSLLA